MKVIGDFVTNSSSVAYVCDVCGNIESGSDSVGMEDYGFKRCAHGHTFCEEHTLPEGDLAAQKADLIEAYRIYSRYMDQTWLQERITIVESIETQEQLEDAASEYEDEYDRTIAISRCPICAMVTIRPETLLKYIVKEYNMDRDGIETNIRERFATAQELDNYLK